MALVNIYSSLIRLEEGHGKETGLPLGVLGDQFFLFVHCNLNFFSLLKD